MGSNPHYGAAILLHTTIFVGYPHLIEFIDKLFKNINFIYKTYSFMYLFMYFFINFCIYLSMTLISALFSSVHVGIKKKFRYVRNFLDNLHVSSL